MKVREIMAKDIVTIDENSTYEDVAKIFINSKITGAPVLDKNGEIIGIISEADLSRALYPGHEEYNEAPREYADFEDREKEVRVLRDKKVTDLMSKDYVSIDPEMPIMKAGAIMLAKNIMRMPVMEDGKLIGIVGRRRLFRNIFKEYLDL